MSLGKRLISGAKIYDGDLSGASSYASKTLSIGDRGNPRGACISSDGTRLITTHLSSSQHWFNQYNFGTAFDVTSIGTVQEEYQTSATIQNYMTGVVINNALDWISYDPYYTSNYYSQELSTAGDISTAGTLQTDSCTRSGGERTSNSQHLSHNEDTLFLQYDNLKAISLSTAGDLSSGSGCGTSYSLSGIKTDISGNLYSTKFNNDGTKFYGGGEANGTVVQYDLSTAYDISTRGSVTTFDFSSTIGDVDIRYMQFNTDQTHFFIYDNTNYKVWDFSL